MHQLSEFIEPDFGLLEYLLSQEVLSRSEYSEILSESGVAHRRSEALLNCLRSEDQCCKFLKALEETDQQHVVNFITQNGGQNA